MAVLNYTGKLLIQSCPNVDLGLTIELDWERTVIYTSQSLLCNPKVLMKCSDQDRLDLSFTRGVYGIDSN